MLEPPERARSPRMSKAKQEQVGWRMVDDKATGAQVGLPTKQVPNSAKARAAPAGPRRRGRSRSRPSASASPARRSRRVFEQQKKEPPNRKIEFNVLRDDFFVLSGMQGLKKFYVRAEIRDVEVRGLTILYDQATDGIMDPVVGRDVERVRAVPRHRLDRADRPAAAPQGRIRHRHRGRARPGTSSPTAS